MGPTIFAQGLETYGVQTFSAKEIAFNIFGLMHPLLFSASPVESIWADLSGGVDRLPDLAEITGQIRNDLNGPTSRRPLLAATPRIPMSFTALMLSDSFNPRKSFLAPLSDSNSLASPLPPLCPTSLLSAEPLGASGIAGPYELYHVLTASTKLTACG